MGTLIVYSDLHNPYQDFCHKVCISESDMATPAVWGWDLPDIYFPIPFRSTLLCTDVLSVTL